MNVDVVCVLCFVRVFCFCVFVLFVCVVCCVLCLVCGFKCVFSVQKSCAEVRSIRRFLSRFPHGVTGTSFVLVKWTTIDKKHIRSALFLVAIFFFGVSIR